MAEVPNRPLPMPKAFQQLDGDGVKPGVPSCERTKVGVAEPLGVGACDVIHNAGAPIFDERRVMISVGVGGISSWSWFAGWARVDDGGSSNDADDEDCCCCSRGECNVKGEGMDV